MLEWRDEYKLGDFTVDTNAFTLIMFSLFSCYCDVSEGKASEMTSWGA